MLRKSSRLLRKSSRMGAVRPPIRIEKTMVKIPDGDALDKLLVLVEKEIRIQITALQQISNLVEKLHNQTSRNRQAKLVELREWLIMVSKGDDGELINQDLEVGIDWLENYGVPDLERFQEDISTPLGDELHSLEAKLEELQSVQSELPPNSFTYNRDDDLDEESDGEQDGNEHRTPSNEEDLQKLIRVWKKTYDRETAEMYEIHARMKTGIGLK